ncbi:MAG: hypothetical protein KC912_10440 [Proteobacteria bacterium]|nr:hypothetical protein [Pseudomonadota bacterium]
MTTRAKFGSLVTALALFAAPAVAQEAPEAPPAATPEDGAASPEAAPEVPAESAAPEAPEAEAPAVEPAPEPAAEPAAEPAPEPPPAPVVPVVTKPVPAPAAKPAPKPSPEPAPAPVVDDWGDEGDSAGFSAVPEIASPGEATSEEPTTKKGGEWAVTGFARSDQALWVQRLDTQPLARARQSIDLSLEYKSDRVRTVLGGHAEADLAYRHLRDEYDEATLDTYESQVVLREAYVATMLGKTELAFGRQIAAWGEGDVISYVDVVNPRDLRDPGMADLDDLRLPVLSTRATMFLGYHRIEAMIVHEAHFGFRTPPNGPYSSFPAVFSFSGGAPGQFGAFLAQSELDYRHEQRAFDVANQQYLLRWSYRGPGFDFAIYAASVLEQRGVVDGYVAKYGTELVVSEPEDVSGANLRAPTGLDIILDHRRYEMLAMSGAVPLGAALFKWELHQDFGRNYNIGNTAVAYPVIDTTQMNVTGGMIGLAVSGLPGTDLFAEVGKDFMWDTRTDLLFPEAPASYALRSHSRMMRDDLTIDLALTAFGWTADLGWMGRAEAGYNLGQGVNVSAGAITYQSGKTLGLFSGLDKHSQGYLRLRYDFALR